MEPVAECVAHHLVSQHPDVPRLGQPQQASCTSDGVVDGPDRETMTRGSASADVGSRTAMCRLKHAIDGSCYVIEPSRLTNVIRNGYSCRPGTAAVLSSACCGSGGLLRGGRPGLDEVVALAAFDGHQQRGGGGSVDLLADDVGVPRVPSELLNVVREREALH